MQTAIVTGANGFIGSHLVAELLAGGWRVHALGRATSDTPWPERVAAALREVSDSISREGELVCREVNLGAGEMRMEALLRRDDLPEQTTLFHVAGDTHFTPADVAGQRSTNIDIPVRVVLACKDRIARAVHVSTAFVAGTRTGCVREEELDRRQTFHNDYERSKFDAEAALTAACAEQRLPLVIVRPSIITNDRRTGRASTFTHLNALVEVVHRLQAYYHLADGEVVSERIRLQADPRARPNLAPVDSIVPPLLRIAGAKHAAGKTFHLCHPNPQSTLELLELICEVYQVKGKFALEFAASIPEPLSRTEKMALRSLKPYAPYMNSSCEFDVSQSRSVVPDYDAYFSPLDLAYLRKIVAFQREQSGR